MSGCNGGEPYNSFAVVGYVPGPAGEFIDRLRRELEPQCAARAHVTILPPRALACSPEEASKQLRSSLADFHAFRIRLEEVNVFPGSDVIYLSIGSGFEDLKCIHERLSRGACQGEELWNYCPHITLARPGEGRAVAENYDLARRRWEQFRHSREFTLEEITFVQNIAGDNWADLLSFQLTHVFELK